MTNYKTLYPKGLLGSRRTEFRPYTWTDKDGTHTMYHQYSCPNPYYALTKPYRVLVGLLQRIIEALRLNVLLDKLSFSLRIKLEGGIVDAQVDGIDMSDAHDFVDAFISEAYWKRSGLPLSENDLNTLSADGDYVYQRVMDRLY